MTDHFPGDDIFSTCRELSSDETQVSTRTFIRLLTRHSRLEKKTGENGVLSLLVVYALRGHRWLEAIFISLQRLANRLITTTERDLLGNCSKNILWSVAGQIGVHMIRACRFRRELLADARTHIYDATYSLQEFCAVWLSLSYH